MGLNSAFKWLSCKFCCSHSIVGQGSSVRGLDTTSFG